jgi:hypothetical protein
VHRELVRIVKNDRIVDDQVKRRGVDVAAASAR